MFGRLQHGTLSFARWRYQHFSETVLHNAVARLLSVSCGLSCNIVLVPGFTVRVSDYVHVLYHTNIALDTHIKFRKYM